MSDFKIDDSRAPLIVVRFPDVVTLQTYEGLFDRYVELCSRHTGIAWLIDMRRFNPVTAPAPIRKAAADVFTRAREPLLRSTLCEARVVESVATRGVLMAFDWMTGGKWPVKNVSNVDDAEAWLLARLAER